MKVRNRRRLRSREDMIGWRAKRGKLWEKTVENQRSRATRRAAGSPVRRSIGKRAPTAPPQVSAGHKRITDTLPTAGPGAPRATSTCRLRAPTRRSAPGPAGHAGARQTTDIFLSLCCPHTLVAADIACPEEVAKGKRRPARKRRLRRFSSKQDFIGGAGAASHAPPASPRGPPGPVPALRRPSLPRGAPGRAQRSPAPEVAAAARRRPDPECGPGLGRRILPLLHRGGRESRD